jgi:PAS domain-containing protein
VTAEGRHQSDRTGAVVEYAMAYPDDPDADITLLSISPNVVEVFGYDLGAWDRPEDQWLQMLHPGDYPRAVSATWGAVRLGTPYSVEYRVITNDGAVLWVHDEAVIERDGPVEIWRGRFTLIQPPPSGGWTSATLGPRIISILGVDGSKQLLAALEGAESDRTALVGDLSRRENAGWLADLLIDLEMDEPARLRIARGLRMALTEQEQKR